VKKGETIGTIGNTGNAKRKAAHLHFSIYGGGRAVNPLPYVKNAQKVLNPTAIAVARKPRTRQVAIVAKTNKLKDISRRK
jgi:hypothetical protein